MENIFSFLVCIGVSTENTLSNEILLKQNPYRQKRGGLGFGIHAMVKTKIGTRKINIRINNNSPLRLIKKDLSLYILNNEKIVAEVKIFEPPAWIHEKVSTGVYVSEILQQHTDQNLVGILGGSRCILFDSGTSCSFCEMSGGVSNINRTTKDILEALSIIKRYKKNYKLTFTSPLLSSKELEAVCGSLHEITNEYPDIPVAFESQPVPNYLLDILKASGVHTWMVPLDCYSETAQKAYIPGKQKILSNFYWQSLPHAVSLFGEGNVISNLLIGVEHEYYTQAAIHQIIDRGVIPDLIPIRSSLGFEKETNPELFERMHLFLRDKINQSGLSSRMGTVISGCAACGGCSAGISANRHKK